MAYFGLPRNLWCFIGLFCKNVCPCFHEQSFHCGGVCDLAALFDAQVLSVIFVLCPDSLLRTWRSRLLTRKPAQLLMLSWSGIWWCHDVSIGSPVQLSRSIQVQSCKVLLSALGSMRPTSEYTGPQYCLQPLPHCLAGYPVPHSLPTKVQFSVQVRL